MQVPYWSDSLYFNHKARHFSKKIKNSHNSQENLCRCLSFTKIAGLRPETYFKKRLRQRCFLVNFDGGALNNYPLDESVSHEYNILNISSDEVIGDSSAPYP